MTNATSSVPMARALRIPLSDGVELSGDLYAAGDSAPAVVMFSPYLKGDLIDPIIPIRALNEAGLNVVVVDIRGTGDSGGVFPGPLSPLEATDGAEVVEWVASQQWCTGKVGLGGGSYPGAIQLIIAARRPRGLACIAPAVAPIDFYRDWTHRGGIPSHSNWASATFLQTPQPARSIAPALEFYYGTAQATPTDGPVFQERSPISVLDQIDVPILFIGGLYDYFARGTLRGFDSAGVPKRLVFGPWGHQYPNDPAEVVAWFAYWLLGQGTDPTADDNVVFWRIGTDEWVHSTGRSIPAAPSIVHVGPLTLPVRATQMGWPMEMPPSPVDVAMDSGTPSGMHLWGEDVTVLLDHVDGDIEGAPIVRLTLRAQGCDDAELHTRLCLQHEDGSVEQLTEGRIRLSHRAIDEEKSRRYSDGSLESVVLTHVDPVPLSEDQELVQLEMLITSVRVPEGARLRLGLSARRVDGVSRRASLEIAELDLVLPILDESIPASS